MQKVLEYLIVYGCIGTVWESMENALYGYSQSSSVDALVAGYLAYRLAVWIWRHTYDDNGDSV